METRMLADTEIPQKSDPEHDRRHSVARRWTPLLSKRFCPVSSAFLEHYHELQAAPGARAMNSTEAMLLVHLMDHKWDERAPFPTVSKLAERMGLSARGVRNAMKNLEDSG